MKNFVVAAVSLLIATFTNVVAAEQKVFVGALLGNVTTDLRAAYNEATDFGPVQVEVQDSKVLGLTIQGGYNFWDWFAVELQYMQSASDKIFGEIAEPNTRPFGQLDVTSSAIGVYSVFTAGKDIFIRAKLGAGQSTLDFDTDLGSHSASSAHLSYGFAIGQRIGGLGTLEFQFMRYPDVIIDRADFATDIANTTTKRRTTNEALMIGYIFEF